MRCHKGAILEVCGTEITGQPLWDTEACNWAHLYHTQPIPSSLLLTALEYPSNDKDGILYALAWEVSWRILICIKMWKSPKWLFWKLCLDHLVGKWKPNQRRPKVTTGLQLMRQGWGQEFHYLGTSPTWSDAVRGAPDGLPVSAMTAQGEESSPDRSGNRG